MVKYDYELKRSARRSVSVCIKDDNSIIVNAPLKMPLKDIEKFLLSKSDWIDLHLRRNQQNNAFLTEILSYQKVLVAGKAVTLTIGASNEFLNGEVRVKSIKSLKKLFADNLGGRFLELFDHIKAQNNFRCSKVEFKDYKAKWGCCDRSGNITFNYKLLMLPPDLWRYVAVHELCHTVYFNHSKSFYALVERVLPNYKTDINRLNLYSRITRLY